MDRACPTRERPRLLRFGLGAIRLVVELMNGANQDGLSSGLLSAIAAFDFLHLAIVLFVICVAILIGVSVATGDPPHDKIAGLTFGTADEPIAWHTRDGAAPTGEGQVAAMERTQTEVEHDALDLEESGRDRRRDLFLSIGVVICVALVRIIFA